ncbi:class I SAM-dependent methyltransferase [Ancylobacter radicis]|uniref:Class I SAM-dependent methyltransferase n=1 Tax=Ancylobacter radicis TaxID=2836179 RepID=A0ABS5R351_9HYPH|nr:class I SAM-dependent methyltransferase [Ancylobacter radicis]MBS9476064.1 class I SAM-dependent methyltransferase [Ancylobacter radicis]
MFRFRDVFRKTPARLVPPLALAPDRAAWDAFLASPPGQAIFLLERELLRQHARDSEWTLEGYSRPARQTVAFAVDQLWGGREENGVLLPNLRERLVCPVTQLNNRQRLMASLIEEAVEQGRAPKTLYFMEEVTPIFAWSQANLRNVAAIHGSEYLGPDYPSGTVINGLHHEDIHALSFASDMFDLIVSNEVFEHIPSPPAAFRECHRVLKRDGEMIMTTPFFPTRDASIRRADIGPEGIVHLLPPMFHGNPVSEEGSLVFYDFGWDILDMAREAGFSRSVVEIHHAPEFGHLTVQPVFRFRK